MHLSKIIFKCILSEIQCTEIILLSHSLKKDKLIFNIKADTVKKKNPGKGNRGSASSKKDPALVQ